MWYPQVLPTVSKSLYFSLGLGTVMWSFKVNITFGKCPVLTMNCVQTHVSAVSLRIISLLAVRVVSAGRDI